MISVSSYSATDIVYFTVRRRAVVANGAANGKEREMDGGFRSVVLPRILTLFHCGYKRDLPSVEFSALDILITGSNPPKRTDFSITVLNTNFHHYLHIRIITRSSSSREVTVKQAAWLEFWFALEFP